MKPVVLLEVDTSFTSCTFCGGVLRRRKDPEVYYYCTICEHIFDVREDFLRGPYWQYVQYDEIDFIDAEDFSPRKTSVAEELLYIPEESKSDTTFLFDLLRDMQLLGPESSYDFEVYMEDVLVRTSDGRPVGCLERWRIREEEHEDESDF